MHYRTHETLSVHNSYANVNILMITNFDRHMPHGGCCNCTTASRSIRRQQHSRM